VEGLDRNVEHHTRTTVRAVARSGSQSVERALAVLQHIAQADDDVGVSEIAIRTGLSISTAHRLIQALRGAGLVSQDERTERYHLGPGAVALGRRAEARLGFDRLLPHLRTLGAKTGESISLGTRVGTEMLVVLHVDSPHPLRFDLAPGTRAPIHASAIGKVLLAFAPDPAAEVAALGPLPAVTAATLTDPDALVADLATTRRRGWALNDGERDVGVRTVASPLLGADGTAWAGVAVQGPAARLPDDRLAELAALLVESAAAMAQDVA
jgi:IclR family transcriptional regulator, acetate operon repressor